jgi:hypothetical protein
VDSSRIKKKLAGTIVFYYKTGVASSLQHFWCQTDRDGEDFLKTKSGHRRNADGCFDPPMMNSCNFEISCQRARPMLLRVLA